MGGLRGVEIDRELFLAVLRRQLPADDADARELAALPDDAFAQRTLDVPFVDLGFDSMRTIELLLDLEESFEIVMPEEYLTDEVLRTPQALADALAMVVPAH